MTQSFFGESTVQRMTFFSNFFSFFSFSKDDCHHMTEPIDGNNSSEKPLRCQKTVTNADKQNDTEVV